ncbi:5-bromo-4-chloroindolyl phosphate hydrolysis family protein [Ostreibacterium oceani]|uniref:5-bromo-4-chloroindolyl phosphate hydrolysis protein n=1 Tax=Ostreibacterium oceani TaxID=2654998 RepID=A0A6N7F3H0_9GAMM|nr:5-bromo-4-chloroindolyl phosphate hydrolysis family protein [Ostreibacterium oceani]MPV86416.1 hypothetical protein [Ostreibacterium oceani]
MPKPYQPKTNTANFSASGLLLYILPAPLVLKLLISIITFNIPKVALTAGALFFFYSAAHLTRKTLLRRAENLKRARPKKIKDNRNWAALYLVIGLLFLMVLLKSRLPIILLMSLCAIVGYYFTYGFSEKFIEEAPDYGDMPKATRQAIEGAYADLRAIEGLTHQLDATVDAAIIEKVETVLDKSHEIMQLLVKSPSDAGRARRFLNVYINRIKEILTQYLALAKYGKETEFRERLIAVLSEAKEAFTSKQSQLLNDDKLTLDVQLEVLDEQIKSEK